MYIVQQRHAMDLEAPKLGKSRSGGWTQEAAINLNLHTADCSLLPSVPLTKYLGWRFSGQIYFTSGASPIISITLMNIYGPSSVFERQKKRPQDRMIETKAKNAAGSVNSI